MEAVSQSLSPDNMAKMVVALASKFHDAWRGPRRIPQEKRVAGGPEFEPREKEVNGVKHDIANLTYVQLPEKFQVENKAAAEGALGELPMMVRKYGRDALRRPEAIEALSDTIHQQWMTRNGVWAPAEQMVPYTQLPETEKNKDRANARAAVDTFLEWPKHQPKRPAEQGGRPTKAGSVSTENTALETARRAVENDAPNKEQLLARLSDKQYRALIETLSEVLKNTAEDNRQYRDDASRQAADKIWAQIEYLNSRYPNSHVNLVLTKDEVEFVGLMIPHIMEGMRGHISGAGHLQEDDNYWFWEGRKNNFNNFVRAGVPITDRDVADLAHGIICGAYGPTLKEEQIRKVKETMGRIVDAASEIRAMQAIDVREYWQTKLFEFEKKVQVGNPISDRDTAVLALKILRGDYDGR